MLDDKCRCDALYRYPNSDVVYFCVLPERHWGGHVTKGGFRFSEDEANYDSSVKTDNSKGV